MGAVTKLNALRRLTMKPHAENTAPRKHKEFRVRLYDQDRVVGYVGWIDFLETKVALERMQGSRSLSPVTRLYYQGSPLPSREATPRVLATATPRLFDACLRP